MLFICNNFHFYVLLRWQLFKNYDISCLHCNKNLNMQSSLVYGVCMVGFSGALVSSLVADVALMLLATVFALFLRENFEVNPNHFVEFLPYLLATLGIALAVFPVAGLNRSVWRFSSLHDHLVVTAAVAAVVAGAVGFAFLYNRLDGVARSLPFLQFLTCTAFLTGARVSHRLAHEVRRDRKNAPALLQAAAEASAVTTALIVGITRLAEAYLRAAAEFTPGQIKVAGIVEVKERHTGRALAAHRVLGSPEELERYSQFTRSSWRDREPDCRSGPFPDIFPLRPRSVVGGRADARN